MMPKIVYALLILWTYALMAPSFSLAQESPKISYHFEQDTIEIKPGQSFANKLLIKNHSDKPIVLLVNDNQTKLLSGFIRLSDTITLEPNESKLYPLKYMADRKIIHSFVQPFTLTLTDISNNKVHLTKSFYTKLIQQNFLLINTEQQEYYLDQTTNDVKFDVNIHNTGLVPITFSILLSEIPKGLEFIGNQLPTTLQAGSQMVFPFIAKRNSPKVPIDFNVMIQCVDIHKNILNTNHIRIASIGNMKRYGNQYSLNEQLSNSIALRYLSMDAISNNYQLHANGKFALGNGTLKYQVLSDYMAHQQTINVFNTYLQYDSKKWGLTIGNLFEDFDHNVSGTGIKANFQFNENASIKLIGLQRKYFIYGGDSFHKSDGNIFATEYRIQSKLIKAANFYYIHNTGNKMEAASNQLSTKLTLLADAENTLVMETGISLENNSQKQHENGFAAGINYNHLTEKWQINLHNYYSSPYYSGLRRGFLQSEARIAKQIKNQSQIYLRGSMLQNNPKYIIKNDINQLNNKQQMHRYELGYTQSIANLSFNLSPYILIQHLDNMWIKNTSSLQQQNVYSNAIRGFINVNYSNNKHRISLNTDYGYAYKNSPIIDSTRRHSWRINSQYSFKSLGFSMLIQLNPYYISEYSNHTNNKKYEVYSLGPNANFNLFKNKLYMQFNLNYNYYRMNNTQNVSTYGVINWSLMNNWKLSLDFNYTQFQYIPEATVGNVLPIYNSYSNKQMRVGVVKNFGTDQNNVGHKLTITYFEDANNNGIRDKSELLAKDILVKISKDATITDVNGKVIFTNLKDGEYTIQIANNNNFTTNKEYTIAINRNLHIEIPLVKKKILKGKIHMASQKYVSSQASLAGIRVNARDEYGNLYKTLTNEQGNYLFYLPIGKYKVYIETTGLNFSIENNTNEITIVDSPSPKVLDFIYKDETRKVEIKRF